MNVASTSLGQGKCEHISTERKIWIQIDTWKSLTTQVLEWKQGTVFEEDRQDPVTQVHKFAKDQGQREQRKHHWEEFYTKHNQGREEEKVTPEISTFKNLCKKFIFRDCDHIGDIQTEEQWCKGEEGKLAYISGQMSKCHGRSS